MEPPVRIDPIEDLTRRRLLTAVPGFVILAAGIACGDDDDDSEETATEAPANTPTAQALRSVETPLGPVDVPARAERIVVFDRRGTLGYLLDLGVVPVGAMSAPAIYGSEFHPLLSGVADVETIDWEAPDLEAIAVMQPDLIIGFQRDVEPVFDQLSGIAPTVAVAIDLNNPQLELTDLGRVLGMEEKAAELLGAFEADVADARTKVTREGTVSIILPVADGIRIYRGDDMAGQIIRSLGQTITPDIQALGAPAEDDILVVSLEQASVLDGDTIVVYANLSEEERALREELLAAPVFQAVPAVVNGRIVKVESQAVFGTAGLTGQRQVLEALTAAFA